MVKPYMFDLYRKLKDTSIYPRFLKRIINADVNGARNILRKFDRGWFDLIIGLKRTVKVRIYNLTEGISKFLQYAGIGVCGGVSLPRGIRTN